MTTMQAPRSALRTVRPYEVAMDASDLGLRPGQWPDSISVMSRDGAHEVRFSREAEIYAGRGSDRELAGVQYRAEGSGLLLTLVND